MPPNVSALAAATICGGIFALKVAKDFADRKRKAELEQEQSDIKQKRREIDEKWASSSNAKKAWDRTALNIGRRHTKLFLDELDRLCDDMDREASTEDTASNVLSQIPLLGQSVPSSFVRATLLLLFGNLELLLMHVGIEDFLDFGFAARAVSGKQLTAVLKWLEHLSQLDLPAPFSQVSRELADDTTQTTLIRLCLRPEDEAFCLRASHLSDLVQRRRGKPRAKLASVADESLGIKQHRGGGYVNAGEALEFHTRLGSREFGHEAVRASADQLWWHNLAHFPQLSARQGIFGFSCGQDGSIEGAVELVQPTTKQRRLREDLVAHFRMQREAKEVLNRLARVGISLDSEGCQLTAEWAMALAGEGAISGTPIVEIVAASRQTSLLQLRDEDFRASFARLLQEAVPKAKGDPRKHRAEVSEFVPIYFKFCEAAHFQTLPSRMEANLYKFPHEYIGGDSTSVCNEAMKGILVWGPESPTALKDLLYRIQTQREEEKLEFERQHGRQVGLLPIVALGALAILLWLFVAAMTRFGVVRYPLGTPTVTTACLLAPCSSSLRSWLAGTFKDGCERFGAEPSLPIMLGLALVGVAVWVALLWSCQEVAILVISSATTVKAAMCIHSCLPDAALLRFSEWLYDACGLEPPHVRDFRSLRGQSMVFVRIWHHRLLLERIRFHTAQRRIRALDGVRLMEAIASMDASMDVAASQHSGDDWQDFPGSLKEAEDFLELEVDEEAPVMTEQQADLNISDVFARAEEQEHCKALGYEVWHVDDSDDEGAEIEPEVPAPPDMEQQEADVVAAHLPGGVGHVPRGNMKGSRSQPTKIPRRLRQVLDEEGWRFQRRGKHYVYKRIFKTPQNRGGEEQMLSVACTPSALNYEKKLRAKLRRKNDPERSRA